METSVARMLRVRATRSTERNYVNANPSLYHCTTTSKETKDGNTVSEHYTCAPDRINLPTYTRIRLAISQHGLQRNVDTRKRYCRYCTVSYSRISVFCLEYLLYSFMRHSNTDLCMCAREISHTCKICHFIT